MGCNCKKSGNSISRNAVKVAPKRSRVANSGKTIPRVKRMMRRNIK